MSLTVERGQIYVVVELSRLRQVHADPPRRPAIEPTSGEVYVGGADVRAMNLEELQALA